MRLELLLYAESVRLWGSIWGWIVRCWGDMLLQETWRQIVWL